MILEFSVENYRSFKEKQTLSMIPDEGKEEHPDNLITVAEKYKVLKTAVIYGANASGKSNFMKAFQALRNLVMNSASRRPDERFDEYDPYKFNPSTVATPTVFEINFLLNQVRYFYYVAIKEDFILKETLLFYPQGREAKLFVRQEQNFEFGDYLKGQKAVVADITAKNQLFLSKGAMNNITQLTEVYRFFINNYRPAPFSIFDTDQIDSEHLFWLKNNSLNKEKNKVFDENYKALISSFGTGVKNFKIEEIELGWGNFDYKVLTEHDIYDDFSNKIGKEFIPIEEESTGTQKLFLLGSYVIRALINGRILIIDEFERSLHPLISSYIINMFNSPKINTKGAQLIIATHDTNLLTSNHFRRDQIWIVEKDQTGASELFSLADIKGVRDDIPFEKWYLSGRFGGIPGIESLNFELTYTDETN